MFGLFSMTASALLLSLWVNSVYLYGWNILHSFVFPAISASVFLLMIVQGFFCKLDQVLPRKFILRLS